MIDVIIDTETFLFSPGNMSPRLVVLSWSANGRVGLVEAKDATKWLLGAIEKKVRFIGHNIEYDMAVLMQHDNTLRQPIFNLYRQGRILCTKLAEQLLDLSEGRHRYHKTKEGKPYRVSYSLADTLTRYHYPTTLSKGEDSWRMRYSELADIPIKDWPNDARHYPEEDARATAWLWRKQQERSYSCPEGDPLYDLPAQSRQFFGVRLTSNHGILTDPQRVTALEIDAYKHLEEVRSRLLTAGLVKTRTKRKTGVIEYIRDTKSAKKLMLQLCRESGMPLPLTDKGIELGLSPEPNQKPDAILPYIAIDANSCSKTESPTLHDYSALSSLSTVISKDLEFLKEGTTLPIHTTFGLADSGRLTSSKPNIQNIRRLPGIRECFIPRPGFIFAQADYEGLELRTMAQAAKLLVGYSKMGDALNEGRDLHLSLGATFLGISYEEAQARKSDPEVKRMRSLAKPFHFGIPGGLGDASFVDYASNPPYNVQVSKDEVRQKRRLFYEAYPEILELQRLTKSLINQYPPGEGVIVQAISKRIRGGCFYTSASNSWYQGLGADAAKNALFLVQFACYTGLAPDTGMPSPLFNSRVVNIIHDELIVEVPDNAYAAQAAYELTRLMKVGAAPFMPDYPAKVDPGLMAYWSKDAQALFDPKLISEINPTGLKVWGR